MTKPQTQWHPAVAGKGTHFLVVWEEYHQEGNDIYGARVNADGSIVETNGFLISTAANLQASPVIATTSHEFLVVWQDYRHSVSNIFFPDIWGARLTEEGKVLDTEGMALARFAEAQWRPAVVGSGDQYWMVWQDYRHNPTTMLSDIKGARWQSTDQGLKMTVFDAALSPTANAEWTPAVAAHGTNSLLVWADNRLGTTNGWDIFGARLSGAGQILDLAGFPICAAPQNQWTPAIAANGSGYLVVWADGRPNPASIPPGDIYGTRIGLDGNVFEPNGFAVTTATQEQSHPAVASLGSDYLVVWQDARNSVSNAVRWDIYGARIDAGGSLLVPSVLPVCIATNNQVQPAIAANGTDYLVVWTDYRHGSTADIYGTRLRANGEPMDLNPVPICTARNNQWYPAIAANGADYLVAWTDFRNGTASDIYGARVDRQGVVLETDGFLIRAAPNQQSFPTITANGSDYFVAWQDARSGLSNNFDIFGIDVSGDGRVGDATTLAINTNANHQVVPVALGLGEGQFLIFSQGIRSGVPCIVGNPLNLAVSHGISSRLSSPKKTAGAAFEFILMGGGGLRYAIETSADLRLWTPLTTVNSTNGLARFADPNPGPSQRFYRAITLP